MPSIPNSSDIIVSEAVIDRSRASRCGMPEVVYGGHKTSAQIIRIAMAMRDNNHPIFVTRVSAVKGEAVVSALPEVRYDGDSATLVWQSHACRPELGKVAIVAAGTSDAPVAREAAATLAFMGVEVDLIFDVGVAGLHRLLDRIDRITEARVAIAVAGMEGALPGVLAGLVPIPVIAVPTSVGCGISAGGRVALEGMLSSCAPGLTVVNVDSGFGAACAAWRIIGAGVRG